jgi:acetyl-CoA carboxylase carboxyltransferase component
VFHREQRGGCARSDELPAIQAVHGPALDAAKKKGAAVESTIEKAVDEMRADYEHQLDAKFAAARGYVDAIVYPENTREMLSLALRATLHNPGPHLGPFVLPPHLGEST